MLPNPSIPQAVVHIRHIFNKRRKAQTIEQNLKDIFGKDKIHLRTTLKTKLNSQEKYGQDYFDSLLTPLGK